MTGLTAREIHTSFDGATIQRNFTTGVSKASIGVDSMKDIEELKAIGLDGFEKFTTSYAMDAIQQGLTTPSVGTPIQFLQAWLPGFVKMITAARKIDEILGVMTIGDFYDSEVVQGILENTGFVLPYSDLGNVPLNGVNSNFTYRNTVQFEAGFRVGVREQGVADKMRLNLAGERRDSAAISLEIARNQVGFYGYNAGANLTYGFLNDPNLPSYQTVATGPVSNSKLWSLKTFAEIVADLLTAFQVLQTQSQDTFDPQTMATTLVVPTNCYAYLNRPTDFPAQSPYDWLKRNYPLCRIVSAPQLNTANGGANVFYLFADKVNDTSSDGQQTFIQMVPSRYMTLGVQQMVKGYEEDFANSTAGVMCKRPYAVYRGTGI